MPSPAIPRRARPRQAEPRPVVRPFRSLPNQSTPCSAQAGRLKNAEGHPCLAEHSRSRPCLAKADHTALGPAKTALGPAKKKNYKRGFPCRACPKLALLCPALPCHATLRYAPPCKKKWGASVPYQSLPCLVMPCRAEPV